MKKLVLVIIMGFCLQTCFAQYTLIPDTEFEQRLIAQGIDTEGTLDGQVLTDDIDHITTLDVTTQFPEIFPTISDLTGIEDFISLEFFNFGSNTVQQVDLSNNVNLKTLICKYNNLTSIDVSNNILLEDLDLINCFPSTCDQENTFSSIDLSNNVNLRTFFSSFNYFNMLDFSNNPQLERVSVNYSSTLTSLNIKNGNNIILNIFNAIENPQLTCITVDDPVAATNGDTPPYDNWNVQEGIIFSEDCSLSITENIPINILKIYPNPVKDILFIVVEDARRIVSLRLFDSFGKQVLEDKANNGKVDISNLNSGIYILKIESEDNTMITKIMKE